MKNFDLTRTVAAEDSPSREGDLILLIEEDIDENQGARVALIDSRPIELSDERRRWFLRKSDEILDAIEELNLQDPKVLEIHEKISFHINWLQEEMGVSDSFGRVPVEVSKAHDRVFDLQWKLMHDNPHNNRRPRNNEEPSEIVERGLPRVKWKPRADNGSWQMLGIPDDLDLLEHPEMAGWVEAMVQRLRDRWVYARYKREVARTTGQNLVKAEGDDLAAKQNYYEVEADARKQLIRMTSLLVAPDAAAAAAIRHVLAAAQRHRNRSSGRIRKAA